MLKRVDRVQLTAASADAVAERWIAIFDAVRLDTDEVPQLKARRISIQLGDSLVEILEPTGDGLVKDHLDARRGGPFSMGVTTNDMDALRMHLASQNVKGLELDGQIFLHESALGIPGLSVIVSPHEERTRVGLLTNLYESTHLTPDSDQAAADIARIFGLDQSAFVPIDSDTYGYKGYLTLFDASQLHRVETINPYDETKTMGRYFARFGPSLYMCYGETEDLPGLRERLKEVAPNDWTGSDKDPNGLFVHPRALGGTMVGVSRTTYAWTWSGYPERVVPAS